MPFVEDRIQKNIFKGGIYSGSYVNTAGVDTREIDAYRQGIEITNYRSNALGIYKLRVTIADEPYGQNLSANFTPLFDDDDRNTGEIIINRQMIYNNDVYSQTLNGIIEPLVIRKRIYMTGISYPLDPNDVRGSVMAGNILNLFFQGSDLIETNREFSTKRAEHFYFYDNVNDDFGQPRTPGFYDIESQKLLAFNECIPIKPFKINDTEISQNLKDYERKSSLRLGAKEISATCGFVFEDVAGVGIDSIAFGGMRY